MLPSEEKLHDLGKQVIDLIKICFLIDKRKTRCLVVWSYHIHYQFIKSVGFNK